VSENVLDRLRDYVNRTASRVHDLEGGNAELQEKIDGLQEELEELRRESLTKGRDIEHLKNERLELRSRVQRIRKNISTLEAKESTL